MRFRISLVIAGCKSVLLLVYSTAVANTFETEIPTSHFLLKIHKITPPSPTFFTSNPFMLIPLVCLPCWSCSFEKCRRWIASCSHLNLLLMPILNLCPCVILHVHCMGLTNTFVTSTFFGTSSCKIIHHYLRNITYSPASLVANALSGSVFLSSKISIPTRKDTRCV